VIPRIGLTTGGRIADLYGKILSVSIHALLLLVLKEKIVRSLFDGNDVGCGNIRCGTKSDIAPISRKPCGR